MRNYTRDNPTHTDLMNQLFEEVPSRAPFDRSEYFEMMKTVDEIGKIHRDFMDSFSELDRLYRKKGIMWYAPKEELVTEPSLPPVEDTYEVTLVNNTDSSVYVSSTPHTRKQELPKELVDSSC